VVEVLDALAAAMTRALDLTFDALTTPEWLQILEREILSKDLWMRLFQATSVSVDSASCSGGCDVDGAFEQFAFVEDGAGADEGD